MKWFRRRKVNRRTSPEEPVTMPWPRIAAWSAALVLLVGGAVIVAAQLRAMDWEHFRTLEVTGELERVTPAEVRTALAPYIAQGFAAIDLDAARGAVEELPWVASAALRRQWPGVLAVALREERAVATWFGTSLMNADGDVFVDGAAGFTGVLPDIGGPSGTQDVMVARLTELQQATRASELELRRLLRTERRAERLWLASGGEYIEVRLGRRNVDARLDRFLSAAWPALKARAGQIAYVDMRYTNGFAVGWKTAEQSSATRRERS